MSDYEYHHGKLRKLSQADLEEFAEEISEDEGEQYIKHNGDVYEIFDHEVNDYAEDVINVLPNPDGTLTFHGQFYNGGTYLGEMLGEGLDKYSTEK